MSARTDLVSALIMRLDNIGRGASRDETLEIRDRIVALISDAEAETARLQAQVDLLASVNTNLNALTTALRKQNAELRERWAADVAAELVRKP